jgi:hypothetical protein
MKKLIILLVSVTALGVLAGWDRDPQTVKRMNTMLTYTNTLTTSESVSITNNFGSNVTIDYIDFASPESAEFKVVIEKPSGKEIILVSQTDIQSWLDVFVPVIPFDRGEVLKLTTSSDDAEIKVKVKRIK